MTLTTQAVQTDTARDDYSRARIAHWDRVARDASSFRDAGSAYHRRLIRVYQSQVQPGQRVLEIGCGQGDLLAALQPAFGVGVDFSQAMIQQASRKHPELKFVQADAHALDLDMSFDVIVLSDLVDDLWDVELAFRQLKPLITPRSRLILNFYSRVWELPLAFARAQGWRNHF